jgi:hypothetical protein
MAHPEPGISTETIEAGKEDFIPGIGQPNVHGTGSVRS